jgi:signal transduction histidine kinase/ActR/RegA family two-component response regulator
LGSLVDITERKRAEARLGRQLERLNLLQQLTRAIGERQDLGSIFQVVARSLEEHLKIDFCAVCLYDPIDEALSVSCIGARGVALAEELKLTEQARIPMDESGLSRCVQGQLVYEPDLSRVEIPFPQRLAQGGLRSLVAAPLLVESKVFGVLLAARRRPESFSSGECEFLRQLSEHVALAAHQAQLYGALRQAYDELRQTQQAVMQQERLGALGQMASGIAHDINNAISPVTLYTESLLENEPNLSGRARKYLETIQHAVEDVAGTVSRMRDFYRPRESQLAVVSTSLNKLLQQVVDLTRVRWSDMPQQRGAVVQLQTEFEPDLPAILGVESEIRDALTNLIFNAVDAMPAGGVLTLRTRTLVSSDGSVASRRVQVDVTDTGSGMDEETRLRCFEPFYTTKGERGTGLGLAMVFGMAQRQDAEIDVVSEVGRGTTISLIFPEAPPAGTPAVSVSTARPKRRLRLLTVDDDPLLIKSLRDTLEGDGHLVTAVDGGQAGIDAFLASRQDGEPFAAVITDLGMPHVDGRKVAAAIKAASPETPVILLTGWGQRLVEGGDIPPHVDRVLSKPPKLRELREVLATLCPDPET